MEKPPISNERPRSPLLDLKSLDEKRPLDEKEEAAPSTPWTARGILSSTISSCQPSDENGENYATIFCACAREYLDDLGAFLDSCWNNFTTFVSTLYTHFRPEVKELSPRERNLEQVNAFLATWRGYEAPAVIMKSGESAVQSNEPPAPNADWVRAFAALPDEPRGVARRAFAENRGMDAESLQSSFDSTVTERINHSTADETIIGRLSAWAATEHEGILAEQARRASEGSAPKETHGETDDVE
jgi:hypothetical protein